MENFLLLPRALATALFNAGMAGAVGVLLARLWLIGTHHEVVLRALRRTFLLCGMVMVVAVPVQLWLTVATMVASAAPAQVMPAVGDVLATHAGKVLVPDFALAALLLAVGMLPGLSRSRAGIVAGFIAAALLTAMRSASGHAAAEGDFTLPEFIQFAHLASIAVWAGGVMVAGLVALPELRRQELRAVLKRVFGRLSWSATLAVGVVILSGIYNAWRGLGGAISPLVHSQWGWLLTAKSVLVAVAVGLGGLNRLALRGDEPLTDEEAGRLVGRIRLEAVVMLLVLLVTGFLAGSPPAGES